MFVMASHCQYASACIQASLSEPSSMDNLTSLKSQSAITLSAASATISDSSISFSSNSTTSASSLESLRIACTICDILSTSRFALRIILFLFSGDISGLPSRFSRFIESDVSGVLSWCDMSESASFSKSLSAFAFSADSLK